MAGLSLRYSSLLPEPALADHNCDGVTSGANETNGCGVGVLSFSKNPLQAVSDNAQSEITIDLFIILNIVKNSN